MAKRLKTITAGRLVVVGCYTIPTPRSTERERKALREISSAAQMTINANRSWQRLELLLAANFGRRDLHVVLTYDDEHLPANRQAAVQRVRKMLPQLRAVRKSRGQELKYIYVTEQLSSEGGRLHHHMVVNGTGADLDVLRSLWPYGEVELETLDTWQGYEALAKYLTKEPRELGILLTKGTVKQDWSIHVEFLTDQNCFRVVYRCNGAPKVNKPLTIKNSSKTRSPFVALADRK